MPRSAPLDALGVIHQVTTRGIEDRKICKDTQEREDFAESAVLLAVRELGMPLADLSQGGNEHSRSGVCHRAGENNYPELPISADTLKLIYLFKSVPLFVEDVRGVLKITRIQVNYNLKIDGAKRKDAENALQNYLPMCPAAQSVIGCIKINHAIYFE